MVTEDTVDTDTAMEDTEVVAMEDSVVDTASTEDTEVVVMEDSVVDTEDTAREVSEVDMEVSRVSHVISDS